MAREINLVPDIKGEMIKALKLRNFIFFLCIVVASASVAATVIVGLIMGGQQLALDNRKTTLDDMSTKLNSYSDLSDFLTIKDQLSSINALTNNKKVLSRTFNILSALIPTGADTITISELSVNLSGDAPTFTFDAQANAGKEPFIDYNVLDSFKKSMQYMRYDYGDYVDKNGNVIPAYCIIESGIDGAIFRDSARGIYAYWTINGEGCNPSGTTSDTVSDNVSGATSDSTTDSTSDFTADSATDTNVNLATSLGYATEEYDGQQVVRIWRTPQTSEWYSENPVSGQPYMSLSGEISNVAHFESACITYTGDASQRASEPDWTETNESCLLVPDGTDGIKISDSSNGRGASGDLVLRFSATITFNPAVYSFNNHHVLAIAPSRRYNVTDSYVQIQAMFGERAADCEEGDTACDSNTTNSSDPSTNSGNNGGENG